jgi:hypothetical protein
MNTSEREKSMALNLTARNFGTSNEMVDELIIDIDNRIDQKMQNLIQMAEGRPGALDKLVEAMLSSDDPN